MFSTRVPRLISPSLIVVVSNNNLGFCIPSTWISVIAPFSRLALLRTSPLNNCFNVSRLRKTSIVLLKAIL